MTVTAVGRGPRRRREWVQRLSAATRVVRACQALGWYSAKQVRQGGSGILARVDDLHDGHGLRVMA